MKTQSVGGSLNDLIQVFSTYSQKDAKGTTRLAFTREEWEARQHFIRVCREEQLQVRIDSAGNIIARREGTDPKAPAVACGSHLDSVINGGNYDGTLGVLAAWSVIRRMNQDGVRTRHPVEIICFSAEESSRFGVSTMGSKAMAGLLDVSILPHLKDKNGVTFAEAIQPFGLNLETFADCRRNPNDFKAFVELHIEQGPVLEHSNQNIGIVRAIAAPTRIQLEIYGEERHSGTTTMSLRKDALTAASDITLQVEAIAETEAKNHTVGTVGQLLVSPGATNVIPGYVKMTVEFRSIDGESKRRAVRSFYEYLESLKLKRNVRMEVKELSDEEPMFLDSAIQKEIIEVCEALGFTYSVMPSGAGHDAMNMSRLCPAGLIFVPSRDGISHHPDEFTSERDIENGTRVLYETIVRLAKGEMTS